MVAVNYISRGLRDRLTGERSKFRQLMRLIPFTNSNEEEEHNAIQKLIIDKETGLLKPKVLCDIINHEISQLEAGEIKTPIYLVTLHHDCAYSGQVLGDLLSMHLTIENSRPIADYTSELDVQTIAFVMHADYERVEQVTTSFFYEMLAKLNPKPNAVPGIAEYVPGVTDSAEKLIESAKASYQEAMRRTNIIFPPQSDHTLDDTYINNGQLPPRYSKAATKKIETLCLEVKK